MINIPTAEEFLKHSVYITQDDIEDVHDSISVVAESMREFAQLHVQAALEAASNPIDKYGIELYNGLDVLKKTILNAYPLNLIE